MKGRINWYDFSSKHGSIVGTDNIWYRIHEFTEIDFGYIGEVTSGQVVEFELVDSSVHPIVSKVKILYGKPATIG